jgi:hypothetical protein
LYWKARFKEQPVDDFCSTILTNTGDKDEPVSLTFHSPLKKLNTEPSIGASHQISVHLAKQFQRRRFLEIDQSETRIAYGGHACLWEVLYKDWSFCPDPLTNMGATGNSCF